MLTILIVLFVRVPDYDTVFFDSHDISKPHSSSALTELDDHDGQDSNTEDEPSSEWLNRIVKVVRSKLDVALFGIDVIMERGTGRYAIIDMNLFPGYDGVDNFLEELRDLVVDEIKTKKDSSNQSALLQSGDDLSSSAKIKPVSTLDTEKHHDIDSGIDTSDSCDEKKNKPLAVAKVVKRQHSKSLTTT